MKWLLVLTFYITVVDGNVMVTASDDNGAITCIKNVSPNVKLTCKVTPLQNVVQWRVGGTDQTQCSNNNDVCIPVVSAAEPRYTFTSNISVQEFYFNIANYVVGDDGNYECKHSTTDTSTFDAQICASCPVENVTNGEVNTTQSSVIQDTVIGITCNAGYTIEGSSALTCQSDGTWDLPWPTCPTVTTTTTPITTTGTTTSDIGGIVGGAVGGGCVLAVVVVVAVLLYMRSRKRPTNVRYNKNTLTFDPPKKQTPEVVKYHIQIRKDQLNGEENAYFQAKNFQGSQAVKLKDDNWLYIDEVKATERTIHYKGLTKGKNHVFRVNAQSKDGLSSGAESAIGKDDVESGNKHGQEDEHMMNPLNGPSKSHL